MIAPVLDCYRLLGLRPGVGEQAVRLAFLKLAAETSPDKGGPSDVERFVRLRRAFRAALGHERGREESAGDDDNETGEARPGLDRPQPHDIVLPLTLTAAESEAGLRTTISYQRRLTCPHCADICTGCLGQGWLMVEHGGRLVRRTCPACGGRRPRDCPACGGRRQVETEATVHVQVPAGAESGWRLILSGQGHQAQPLTGDLILVIRVAEGGQRE